ncbi:MAG: hypothetical protein IIU73_00140 [Selenomonadales bacterium]|nr:hypothetical protein [Selenomonadales bacterium]
MIMSNKLYDYLRVAQMALPLLATFYLALCVLWALPLGDEISGTVLAVEALLGGFLEISKASYNKLNG